MPDHQPARSDPPVFDRSPVKDNMRHAVDNPGEWWMVATYSTAQSAWAVASHFRRGAHSRKPPVPGRWEYKTGPAMDRPGRFGLWVRYLGPEAT